MTSQSLSTSDQREFFHHFTVALLWSSTGEDPGELTDEHGLSDLAEVTSKNLQDACNRFLEEHAALINQALDQDGYSLEQAGHDLALSCNGHGAGFFDRGLGDLGETLQEAARAFGPIETYVGDDGLVYVAGMETELEPEKASPRRPKP